MIINMKTSSFIIECPLFWTIFILIINIVHCINIIDNVNTLKLVILIHRHGDRTPINTYPRDPYSDEQKYWPDGWGQLTLKGKNRMYNLGLYLSKRYKNFLGNTPREVFIRSSSSDRCLESVSLILAALYPPNGRWKWNNNLGQHWQPFPIQTVPHEMDGMLNPESKCKKAEQIKKEIYNSEIVQEYYNRMKSTLLYVQDNTGYECVDLQKAEEIYDALLIEKLNNFKLPAWVDENIFDKLKDITDKTFIFSSMNKMIQKFRTGLLLSDIWKHISNNNDNNNKYRLYIYSTHDDQLSVFMNALNNFNNLAPPFGSTIMIELHQNPTRSEQDETFITMYYLNETETEKPYQLNLNKCVNIDSINNNNNINNDNKNCTIKNFYELIKDLMFGEWNDWIEECENSIQSNIVTDPLSIYLVLITISLSMSVILFFIYLLINHRRYGSSYRLLPINS